MITSSGGWNLQDLLKCLPPFWFKPPVMFHTLQDWCVDRFGAFNCLACPHPGHVDTQPGHTALNLVTLPSASVTLTLTLCHIDTHPLSH